MVSDGSSIRISPATGHSPAHDIPALEAFLRGVAVPVIAAGGVASRDELVTLERIGAEGVVIGRALYEGRLHLRALIVGDSR